MAGRFELEVLTTFRSVGLSEMAGQARRALAEINSTPGLSAASRATRASAVRVEATRSIDDITTARLADARSRLTGNQLAREEAVIRGEGTKAQAALTRLFKNLETEFKQIADAVTKSGIIIPSSVKDARLLAGTTPVPRTAAEERIDRKVQLAQENAAAAQGLVGNAEYIEAKRAEAVARQQSAAEVARVISADEEYILATHEAAVAQRNHAAVTRSAELGVYRAGASTEELEAAVATKQRINADLQAAGAARLRASRDTVLGQEAAVASAQRRQAERELAAVLHQEARQEVREAIARGEGTFTQRLQARFQRPGAGQKLPDEFQTLGQVIGSRGISTLGFAVSGTLLYGAVRGLSELLKASEELQKSLNQVNAQLDSMGDHASIETARDGILSIARATGVTSTEVAKVFAQFRGAFGDRGLANGLGGTNEALRQTAAAMQIVQVTGLSLNEVIDSLTATAITFGVNISDIGDTALGLQERFGVLANQTITFVADLAPVAQQIGLSMKDLAAIGAVAQQVSGKAGGALAENFNRVLPTIQNLKTDIVGLYNLPALQQNQGKVINLFATGQSGQVFEQLIRDYNSLNKAQQAYLISLLGTRRDAGAVISVLENSSKVVRELDANQQNLGRDNGKLNNYFKDLQSTVANSASRLGETFKQLGINLFESGIGQFLADAANAANAFVGAMAYVISVLGELNDMVKGIPFAGTFLDPGRLAEIASAMYIVTKAVSFVTEVIKKKTVADQAETLSSGENATANQAEAVASGEVATAKTAEQLALFKAAQADAVEGAASAGNAVTNSAAGLPYATSGGRLSGILGAGLSPAARIGIPVAGALVVASAYQAKSADVQKSEDALIEKLKSASREELVNLSKQHTDFWSRVSIRFFGKDLPEELATTELVKRDSGQRGDDITTLLNHDADMLVNKLKGLNGDDFNGMGLVKAINKSFQANDKKLTEAVADALGAKTPDQGWTGYLPWANDPTLNGGDEAKKQIDASSINPENLKKIITLAREKGDQFAGEILRLIDDYIQHTPDLKAALGQDVAADTHQAAVDAAGGPVQYNLLTLQQSKQLFEAGGITSTDYIAKLKETIATNKQILQAAKDNNQPLSPEDILAQAQTEKELRDYMDNRIKKVAELQNQIASLTNAPGAAALLNVRNELDLLKPGSGLSVEAKFAEVPAALQALHDNFQQTLNSIKDPVARYKAATAGFQIPDEIRVATVAGELKADDQFAGFIQVLATATGSNLDDMANLVAQALLNTDATVKETIKQIIIQKISDLKSQFEGKILSRGDYESYQRLLEPLNVALWNLVASGGPDPGKPYVPPGTTGDLSTQGDKDAVDAENRAIEQQRIELSRAQSKGDPVQNAMLDQQLADIALKYATKESERLEAEVMRVNADNALAAAQADIDKARIELYASEVARDPIRSAQAAVQLAYLAIAQAHGEAEQIRAQAQLETAQHQLLTAQQDITYAWLEQLESYYTTIGDSVDAAKTALQLAQQKLNDLLADPNSGDADRIRAQTAVNEAAANVRDTQLRQQEQDIDVVLQLEKITTSQAIAQLEALLQIPNLTTEQTNEILLKIKQLKDQLGQDLQFNLPSEIDVNGLFYQSRRLNQAGSFGPQVTDNRTISLFQGASINADAGQLQDAVDTIIDTITAPPRNGPRLGAY